MWFNIFIYIFSLCILFWIVCVVMASSSLIFSSAMSSLWLILHSAFQNLPHCIFHLKLDFGFIMFLFLTQLFKYMQHSCFMFSWSTNSKLCVTAVSVSPDWLFSLRALFYASSCICPFLLDAKYCEFYSVVCWIFLYSVKHSWDLFWNAGTLVKTIWSFQIFYDVLGRSRVLLRLRPRLFLILEAGPFCVFCTVPNAL